MKKLILILAFLFAGITAFSQSGVPEPTHTLTPSKFKPGNWHMLGAWDSTNACYQDTLGYYMEGDTVKIWSNKILWINGNTIQPNLWKLTGNNLEPVVSTNFVNTDSAYYIKGTEFIKYYKDEYSMSVGNNALDTLFNGIYNTAIGPWALSLNYNGNGNTALGFSAGSFNSSGAYNTMIGLEALMDNTTGCDNTAVGGDALQNNTIGNANVSIGRGAMVNNISGDSNIAIGYKAGHSATFSNRLWVGQGDSTHAIIYGEMLTRPRIRINGELTVSGEIKYHLIHGVASTDSISFTTGSTQSVYYKLDPTGADTLKDHEQDGITFPGDSIKVSAAGDYVINCYINITTSNAADKIRVKLYKNNAAYPLNTIGRWIVASDGSGAFSETKSFMWYVTLAANDILSIRVANISAARACVLRDLKIYISKLPE